MREKDFDALVCEMYLSPHRCNLLHALAKVIIFGVFKRVSITSIVACATFRRLVNLWAYASNFIIAFKP